MTDQTVVTLLTIFVPLTGLAVLLQASVLLGIFLTVRKAVSKAREEGGEFRGKLEPVLDTMKELMEITKGLLASSQGLIAKLGPRLESAAVEMDAMVQDLHAQASRLQASIDEVALKARHQADRVDGMATSLLNGLERLGSFVNEAVAVPIRQINGVVAAAKAVVETLSAPAPRGARNAAPPASTRSEPMHQSEPKDAVV